MAKDKRDTQNTPNREQLINMAIRSAKQGQRKAARMMLQKVLAEDKRNERAMIMMAKLASGDKDRRKWYNRALQVNPDSEAALDGIAKMDYEDAASRNRALYRIILGASVAAVIVLSVAWVLIAAIGAANI